MQADAEILLSLMRYEIWCNARALNFLAALRPDELHRDFAFGLRTPHHTIFHILNVMRTWSPCVGPTVAKPDEPLPYSADLSLEKMRDLLQTLGEAWLEAARASLETGLLHQDRRLNQLLHLVTHGSHHRGQLLSMVTLLGYAQPFEGGDFGGWSNQQT